MSFPQSFTLSDGTQMPTIAWGNGSGDAAVTAIVSGELALRAGLRHIDTAQVGLPVSTQLVSSAPTLMNI